MTARKEAEATAEALRRTAELNSGEGKGKANGEAAGEPIAAAGSTKATRDETLKAALEYAAKGWMVFPADVAKKKSFKAAKYSNGRPWGMTTDPEEIKRDFSKRPNAGIGLPTMVSGFFVVEADTLEGHDVDGLASLAALEEKHGQLPRTRKAVSPSGSEHYYFNMPAGVAIKNSTSKVGPGIDVRGKGGMVVAPPSLRPGKGQYEWLDEGPIADAPQWVLDLIAAAGDAGRGDAGEQSGAGVAEQAGERTDKQADPARLAKAMRVIPNDNLGWEKWNEWGFTIWVATGGSEAGRVIFHDWSRKSDKHDADATQARWDHYPTSPPTKRGAGTIFKMAAEIDPDWERADDNKRPVIHIRAHELHKMVDEAEAALLLADSGLYKFGPRIVRVVLDKIKTFAGTGYTLRLSKVTAAHLTERLTAAARFEKYDKREKKWVKCGCPPNIAETYLARDGDWKLPIIQAVVNIPTFRPDGSLIDKPGYDEATGLVFDPMGVVFPPILDEPTRADALKALAVLKEPIAEFKFIDDASKSVVISGMISATIRRSLSTAPLHFINASTAGIGKSLLVDVCSVVATGERASLLTASDDPYHSDVELEKKLSASLLAGTAVVSLDNITQPLKSNLLCQMLTAESVEIRVFGKLDNVKTPSTSSIFVPGTMP